LSEGVAGDVASSAEKRLRMFDAARQEILQQERLSTRLPSREGGDNALQMPLIRNYPGPSAGRRDRGFQNQRKPLGCLECFADIDKGKRLRLG
jgi:hypothetical protein